MIEIFLSFLRLGLTSFGGPSAHVGYFHAEYVTRRGWLDEAAFAERLALAQFLPGPASSQLGFAIGLYRGGVAGALAAFAGFTLPSAVLMGAAGAVALALPATTEAAQGAAGLAGLLAGALAGLKLVALAVVAQALRMMAPELCPDRFRQMLAVGTGLVLLWLPMAGAQIGVIALAAACGAGLTAAGLVRFRARQPSGLAAPDAGSAPVPLPPLDRTGRGLRRLGLGLALLCLGLALLPLTRPFLAAGALVFGGGHVILPLLHDSLGGQIDADAFVAGYGLAQALPGPLSTFATYLGAAQTGLAGAMLATVAIFAPGFALYALVLPLWARLRHVAALRGALAAVNAAVVGLLASAWLSQLAPHALISLRTLAVAGLLLALAALARLRPLVLVALGAGLGAVLL